MLMINYMYLITVCVHISKRVQYLGLTTYNKKNPKNINFEVQKNSQSYTYVWYYSCQSKIAVLLLIKLSIRNGNSNIEIKIICVNYISDG